MSYGNLVTWIEFIIVGIGILVLAYGSFDSAVRWIISVVKREDVLTKGRGSVRKHLGTYILLSLEFFIAADILRTVIQPTWEDIGLLAAIVAIRTVLSLFLNMEIKYFK